MTSRGGRGRGKGNRRGSIFDSSPRKKEKRESDMTAHEIIRQLKERRSLGDEAEAARRKRPQSSHSRLQKRPMFIRGETAESGRESGMENMSPPQRPQTAGGGRAGSGSWITRGPTSTTSANTPLSSRKMESADLWEDLGVITIDEDEDDGLDMGTDGEERDGGASEFESGRREPANEDREEVLDQRHPMLVKTRVSRFGSVHGGHHGDHDQHGRMGMEIGMGMAFPSSHRQGSQTATDIVERRIEMLRASVRKKESVWISDVKDCLVEVEIRKRVGREKTKSSGEERPGHLIKGRGGKGEMYESYVDSVVAQRIKRFMDQVGDDSAP
eukprot:TRINITY_DN1649_c0_g1_i2.p1 TRINITY_DN1649_c0_g1~~TRINITY_DN1649_c0_g1_i2.p1  ORF type:complete len:328 (-),score=111.57 TRINITY_DN1649_c0_g1_i2:172-1155(-)